MIEHKGVTYSLKCFNYPVQTVGVGTHSDCPIVYYEPELEGVICIVREDFDIEHLFQGYLFYPEEYQDFYESKDFILYYGPQKNLDFKELLNSEII